ncbi:MAG: type IV pilus modification protein PilV, partial [Proteobacteria bacterium]|nr:type IV pilus modification protein PilV [Pseudomonadota bacterium]
MIEVLVTLLLVSIGYLGIAGLETIAKKINFGSLQRTAAVILAHDIVERMRANPVVLGSYLTPSAGIGG